MNWTSININVNVSCLLVGLILFLGASFEVDAQSLSKDEAIKRACFILTEQLGRKDILKLR